MHPINFIKIKVNPSLSDEVEEKMLENNINFEFQGREIDGGMTLEVFSIIEPTSKQVNFIKTLPVQYSL